MPDTYLFPLQDRVGETLHVEAGRTSDLTPQRQVMAQNISSLGDQKPLDAFHAALMGSSAIPEIGMTFTEAAALVQRKWEAVAGASLEEEEPVAKECARLTLAILTNPPRSIADTRVILENLTDALNDGDGIHEVAALQRVITLLSSVQDAAELSPAIVTAYREWRRIEVICRLSSDMQEEAEDKEWDALDWYVTAAGAVARRLYDQLHRTPNATIADRLFKVRVILDDEGRDIFDIFRTDAGDGLAEVLRLLPMPADLDVPAVPTTDDERRAFLTARPEEIPNTSPADLLRLFTPEQGAEVFALLAGYVQAKRSSADTMPLVLEGIEAYGRQLEALDEPERETDGHFAGAVLTAEERAELARLGNLPEATAQRLSAAATRYDEERAETARRREEAEKQRREEERRATCGPSLEEQLAPMLPDFDVAALEAAAGAVRFAGFMAVGRSLAHERLATLPPEQAAAVAALDLSGIKGTNLAGAQEALQYALGYLSPAPRSDKWANLSVTFAKYATEEQRQRWMRQPAQTRDDLSEDSAEFLRLWSALPPDQQERMTERLELISIQEKAHSAQIAIGRLDGTLSRYREQLAADLEEVDAAMGKTQPDAFADTIAAFEGAAPKPLRIPDNPTDAMVEAGAAAAGIDPEQARAMFAAMVEAYRQEAA